MQSHLPNYFDDIQKIVVILILMSECEHQYESYTIHYTYELEDTYTYTCGYRYMNI